ncbi:MAG: hypothetical protein KBD56_00980 [Candidatus Eisenbacteria bacterium]|nr:hypothetical protein [Candidatus Eisenbacteria bacterium]
MAVIAAVLFLAQSSLPAVLCDGFEASAKDGAHAPADAKALVSAHARGAGGPVAAPPDPDARVSVSFDCTGAWSDNAAAGRLVELPLGARAASIASATCIVDGVAHEVPSDCARVSAIQMMRGTPAVVLKIDRDACDHKLGGLLSNTLTNALAMAIAPEIEVRVEIAVAVDRSAASASAARFGGPDSPERLRASRVDVAREDQSAKAAEQPGLRDPGENDALVYGNRGLLLIITTPEFVAPLADLVAWKTESGYLVRVATTTETGVSREAIRDYIRTAYETWDQPPLYVLLVGDADGTLNVIPTWTIGTSISDHPYACVDGDDFLPDLYIGRLSGKYVNEIALQVAKTVAYESAPDTVGGGAWHTRALTVAGNYNSTTPVSLSRWIRSELLELGFSKVDSVFWSSSPQHPWWNGAPLINSRVNAGVGIVSYRGWALGDIGWQPPTYQSTDVLSLSNTGKLPVVFSMVCHTGNFANYDMDCFGEAWMKAGTLAQPRGAVAFVGTGEPWSHSRWNDRMMIGVFENICHAGEREMARILVGAKMNLIAQFPNEYEQSDAIEDPEETVYYYMHTYNLLGDPSLEVTIGNPRAIAIQAPAQLAHGTNWLEATVRWAEDQMPAAGARVAFSQNDALIGYAETDANGVAHANITTASGDPVAIVVTGPGMIPARAMVAVAQQQHALVCAGAQIAGGGELVAGATANLVLSARNTGSADLTSASAEVSGPAGVELLSSSITFGAIAAGATANAQNELRVRVDPHVEDGARIRLTVAPTVPGVGPLDASDCVLVVSAPRLVCASVTVGGDGIADQGETVLLSVTLRNEGSVSGGALGQATLSLVDPSSAEVIDGSTSWPAIAPGQEAQNTDPIAIRIPADAPGGRVISLRLEVRADGGPVASVPCDVVVGPHDFTVPSGPDAGGYYAYDSADIDYPLQAPVYDWVECSPTYGGRGAKLAEIYDNDHTQHLALPFTFTYYGVPYDTIQVSDNGWISFDQSYWYDIRNWNIPDEWGGSAMVAPFWDNLAPQIAGSDGIYAWHDEARHCFVVEWSRLKNYEAIDDPTTDDYQTFELLLRDPGQYPTESGNGEIIFQYKQIVNDDYTKMYSTVGLEDHTERVGFAYSYSNNYAPGAAPLSPGLAIKFTTEEPVFQPLAPLYFTAARGGGLEAPVEVRWSFDADEGVAGVVLERAAMSGPARDDFVRLNAELLSAIEGGFVDRDAQPGASYRYRLSAVALNGALRLAGEAMCEAFGDASGPMVRAFGGAVSRGPAQIAFSTGGAELRELAVYDLSGRRVADLRARMAGPAPTGIVQWDGLNERGQAVASGVYWVKMRAADGCSETARLVRVR